MLQSSSKNSPTKSQILSIDSNQILTTCFEIKQNILLLEKKLAMVQLRLTTISYINNNNLNNLIDSTISLKYFDNLIDLSSLSDKIGLLLNELRSKLSDSLNNSIDYEIASQQLMFFTSEWYENLTTKLNETFQMAALLEWQNFDNNSQPESSSQQVVVNDEKITSALLRLKQSMKENERLIATISNNVDYTRTTIETIYDSLQSIKIDLISGETNAQDAIKFIRQSNKCELVCYILLISIFGISLLVIVKYLVNIFI